MFSRRLLPRMLMVVALAGLEGFFGWIMVASGLIQTPLGKCLQPDPAPLYGDCYFCLLAVDAVYCVSAEGRVPSSETLGRFICLGDWLVLAFLQIALGAMMSGTKAGLTYPTWPDMNGALPAGHPAGRMPTGYRKISETTISMHLCLP
ncbi:MAG: COX15/CtaA family protein [Dermatophilaceae bacterium]